MSWWGDSKASPTLEQSPETGRAALTKRNHDEVGSDNDCWPWKGSLNKDGKGQFRDGSKAKLAHRVAWELTHGELAPGQTITQECDGSPAFCVL
jgi:hypothetical protein